MTIRMTVAAAACAAMSFLAEAATPDRLTAPAQGDAHIGGWAGEKIERFLDHRVRGDFARNVIFPEALRLYAISHRPATISRRAASISASGSEQMLLLRQLKGSIDVGRDTLVVSVLDGRNKCDPPNESTPFVTASIVCP